MVYFVNSFFFGGIESVFFLFNNIIGICFCCKVIYGRYIVCLMLNKELNY